MVYCFKCGTKNSDNTEFCTKCGSGVHSIWESIDHKSDETRLNPLRGSTIFWLFIGLIAILWGIDSTLKRIYGIDSRWFPLIIILISMLMITGALGKLIRKQ